MGVNLSKGQRVSLDKNMTMALIGLGWDTNKGHDPRRDGRHLGRREGQRAVEF